MTDNNAFRIRILDVYGEQIAFFHTRYVGTTDGLRELLLDEINKGWHGYAANDVEVKPVEGPASLSVI